VDHEVQYHVDIERTRSEDAEAVHLEKHGLGNQWDGRSDGGVKAFEVADLGYALIFGGECDEFVGFGERGGEWLFDEDVDARLHQHSSCVEMIDGGNGDGGGLDLAVSGKELIQRSEGSAVKFVGNRVGSGHVSVDDPEQTQRLTPLFKLLVDTSVIAAERADTDDNHIYDA
jgi:hypothetical protein